MAGSILQEVQASNGSGSAVSISVTLPNNATPGSVFHVIASAPTTIWSSGNPSFSDGTNTYVVIGAVTDTSGGQRTGHAYVSNNTTNGKTTITFTPPSTVDFLSIWVREIVGVKNQAPDGTCTTYVSTATANPSGSLSNTNQPAFMSAFCCNANTGITPSVTGSLAAGASGWTFGASTNLACTGQESLSTTGSQSATFHYASGSDTATVLAAIWDVPSAISITPGVGSVTLSGVAPTLNLGISPSAGALTLNGLAPSVRPISIPVGSISLTGIAPTVAAATGTIAPAMGTIAFSGATPVLGPGIAPSAGAVALSGLVPTFAGLLTIPAGTLTLTGLVSPQELDVVPPLAGAITFNGVAVALNLGITPGAASLVLSGVTPQINGTTNMAPPAGTLTLAGIATTLNLKIAPPVGAISLSGVAPQANVTDPIAPSAGSLSLSGAAPALNFGVSSTPGALSLSSVAPVLNFTITVTAGTLALSGAAPALSGQVALAPASGTIALTGVSGSMGLGLTPSAGASAFAGLSPPFGLMVVPLGTAITITGPAGSLNLSIAPAAGALAFSGSPPQTTGHPSIGAGAITISGVAPMVISPTHIVPAVCALGLTGVAGANGFTMPLTGGTVVLLSSGGSLAWAIQPGAGGAVLQGLAPAAADSLIVPGAASIALAGSIPQQSVQALPPVATLRCVGCRPKVVTKYVKFTQYVLPMPSQPPMLKIYQ